MPIHLQAFYESVDQALNNITPLLTTDGERLLRTAGDNTQVDARIPNVIMAYVGAANAEVARLRSPTLDARAIPYLNPLSATVEPGIPPAIVDLRESPIRLGPSEDMQLQVENDGAAGAQDVVGLLWWADAPPGPVRGEWLTVRATTTAAAMTAWDWNRRTVTLDNALKPGRYELGGVTAIGTTLIAGRVVPNDSVFQPGFLCFDAVTDAHASMFRYGRMGSYGTFRHDRALDLEFFPGAADNESQEIFLDVRRIGD
jgi:hypothetical protein